jgi:hypothetical protein
LIIRKDDWDLERHDKKNRAIVSSDASDKAIFFASILDIATIVCLLETQETGALLNLMR